MEDMERAALNNPDGFGYAFVRGMDTPRAKVMIRKALTFAELREQFKQDYTRYAAHTPFLIHFRWATHGATNQEMAHPFKLRDGGAVIHNGIIAMPKMAHGDSDTQAFVTKVVDRLPRNWQFTNTWVEMVERMAESGNKLAFLWPSGAYLILNESAGHWDRDVWYSNYSHKTTVYRGNYMSDYDASWLDDLPGGGGYSHASSCVCKTCIDEYDRKHPEDLVKYHNWVNSFRKERIEAIAGPGTAFEARGASSVDPVMFESDGQKLPKGWYMYQGGKVWVVPSRITTVNGAFQWFREKRDKTPHFETQTTVVREGSGPPRTVTTVATLGLTTSSPLLVAGSSSSVETSAVVVAATGEGVGSGDVH